MSCKNFWYWLGTFSFLIYLQAKWHGNIAVLILFIKFCNKILFKGNKKVYSTSQSRVNLKVHFYPCWNMFTISNHKFRRLINIKLIIVVTDTADCNLKFNWSYLFISLNFFLVIFSVWKFSKRKNRAFKLACIGIRWKVLFDHITFRYLKLLLKCSSY